ncbi:hypothetical protein C8F01DRAFT_1245329 [Mycena amicta]|nr:hypothetical protein C8F01DRAFT_1245329 [Mycena amicta]
MALSIRVQYALYTLLLLQILMLVLGLMAECGRLSRSASTGDATEGGNQTTCNIAHISTFIASAVFDKASPTSVLFWLELLGSLFFLVFGTPIWFIATLFVNQRSTLESYRQDQSDIEACASEKAPVERTEA